MRYNDSRSLSESGVYATAGLIGVCTSVAANGTVRILLMAFRRLMVVCPLVGDGKESD